MILSNGVFVFRRYCLRASFWDRPRTPLPLNGKRRTFTVKNGKSTSFWRRAGRFAGERGRDVVKSFKIKRYYNKNVVKYSDIGLFYNVAPNASRGVAGRRHT